MKEQLRPGMTLQEVKHLLRGWREEIPRAVLSPEKTRLYYTAHFVPPAGSTEGTLRMTFDNGKLLLWGDPADSMPDASSESA